MKQNKLKGTMILFLTALIWGTAFVAQRVGMEHVEPFTFNGIRSILGGLVLIPYILLTKRKKDNLKELLTGGILCGILLCVASSLQQIGIMSTTAGKAGFITALYIVLVPIFSIFLKKRTGLFVWLGVGLALLGLYLLCMNESFSLNQGDCMLILCAICFALHILVIDYFTQRVDAVKMSCIQFFVCGVLAAVPMFTVETPTLQGIWSCRLPILYAGIMSCGVAYTLQIVGQKHLPPTVASLILSLESVVSVIAGFVILGETMSLREVFGCVAMFAAVILAQLPEKRKKVAKEEIA